jgi:hypothetical protein
MHLLGRVFGRVRHSSLVRSRYASGASKHYEVVYVSGIKSLGNAFTLPFAHPKRQLFFSEWKKHNSLNSHKGTRQETARQQAENQIPFPVWFWLVPVMIL